MRLASGFIADENGRGAVHNARGIARVVHMVDAFDLRVALQGHGIESHRAELLEGRLEPGQSFQGGVGLDEFVLLQDAQAHAILHGHHRAVEASTIAGCCRPLLGLERKRIHVLAGKTVEGGDQVGTDALRHKQRGAVGLRVLRPRAAVRADGHAAHAFHTTGHHQVFPAAADLHGRHVDRFQTRGAEAVELDAGAAPVPARLERRHLGNHRALLADGRDHAHHHVINRSRVQVVAFLKFGQQAGQQVDRLDLVQAAVFLALAAGGADGVVDEGFAHGVSWGTVPVVGSIGSV